VACIQLSYWFSEATVAASFTSSDALMFKTLEMLSTIIASLA
jgi:hypothetical protein